MRLRGWYEVPIIIVSARNQEKERVQALDMGADGYINKPFSASTWPCARRIRSLQTQLRSR